MKTNIKFRILCSFSFAHTWARLNNGCAPPRAGGKIKNMEPHGAHGTPYGAHGEPMGLQILNVLPHRANPKIYINSLRSIIQPRPHGFVFPAHASSCSTSPLADLHSTVRFRKLSPSHCLTHCCHGPAAQDTAVSCHAGVEGVPVWS